MTDQPPVIDSEVGQEPNKAQLFLADYKLLVEKHGMDFANYPMYVPNEKGEFITKIQCTPVDISKKAQPSPFMGKE